MDLGIQGQCAFVAGASQGLGFATAKQLASEGVNIAICARTESRLREAAKKIQEETATEVLTLPGDVTNTLDLDEIFNEIEREWHRLDILVANAGGPPAGRFEQIAPAQYRQAADLSLHSTIEMIYRAVPLMRKHHWGRIIAITSVSVKQPISNLILSNTARAGVVSFCKTVAEDVARDGITVNVVCPGYFKTQRSIELLQAWAEEAGIDVESMEEQRTQNVPLGRYGEPGELADVITFLVSRRASYLTGTAIQVDGGLVRGL